MDHKICNIPEINECRKFSPNHSQLPTMSSTVNMDLNNLSPFEKATRQLVVINQLTRLTILRKDIALAQRVKTRIAKLMEACMSSDRHRPMIKLFIKYNRLEKSLTKFIIKMLKEEYALTNIIEG